MPQQRDNNAPLTGRHLLIDLHTQPALLTDAALLEQSIRAAIHACGARLLQFRSHTFDGGGLTAFAMLAESHISAHTWPEHGFVAFDIFTCGPDADPHLACAELQHFYPPEQLQVREILRG